MRYSKIKNNDIVNGKGITMSIWTQGCPHKCSGCFNPETWDYNNGKEFGSNDLDYILNNINAFNINRNLSILGGEPLCPENIDGVLMLCKKFKEKYPDKLIYTWTGYTIEAFNDIQKQLLNYIDFLIDGKFVKELKNLSLELRGSTNQRVIDIKSTINKNKLVLYKPTQSQY